MAQVNAMAEQELEAVDGVDLRFAVNTVAPYLLTKRLAMILEAGRILGTIPSQALTQPPQILKVRQDIWNLWINGCEILNIS